MQASVCLFLKIARYSSQLKLCEVLMNLLEQER